MANGLAPFWHAHIHAVDFQLAINKNVRSTHYARFIFSIHCRMSNRSSWKMEIPKDIVGLNRWLLSMRSKHRKASANVLAGLNMWASTSRPNSHMQRKTDSRCCQRIGSQIVQYFQNLDCCECLSKRNGFHSVMPQYIIKIQYKISVGAFAHSSWEIRWPSVSINRHALFHFFAECLWRVLQTA